MPKYMNWEEYSEKIAVIDEFNWQQRVRRQSLKNL